MTSQPRRIRTRLSGIILGTSMLLGITACSDSADETAGNLSSGSERPEIVVTTNILGDVVTRLVGEEADVHVLMKPNADPHSFGVSAQDAELMEQADLIVANGLGLETGLSSNLDNARSQGVNILEVGEELEPLEYSPGIPDPHFWTDISQMITATEIIEEELLSGIEGQAKAETISTAAEEYRTQLRRADEVVAEALTAVPEGNRKLVTNHNVFAYLAERFGYTVIGTIIPGGSTLAAPSAADLRDLSEAIGDNQVPAIFADSSQPERLAEVLASESDIEVAVVALFTESLTDPDGEAGSYIDMQVNNAHRIADALS